MGKGKRARPASARPLSSRGSLSLFHPPRVPSPLLSLCALPILSPALSFSRCSPCLLPHSRFRYLLLRAHGFRYLIKSSYDEKDENPARVREDPPWFLHFFLRAMLAREKPGNDNERQVKAATIGGGGGALFESAN